MITATKKDQSQSFVLPSGATMHISRPSFADASRLRNALARAFSSAPLSADEMKSTIKTLKENPAAGGALFQRVLNVVSSQEVEAALFEVLGVALYQPKGSADRLPINHGLFDDPKYADEARIDFYVICYRAAEVAVKPFLGAIVSMFSEFQKKAGSTHESQSK
jgi:hypothetical protein